MDVQFGAPNGLVLAPRELYGDGDAVVLMMCDMLEQGLCIIRVHY
jgi:hypothetical protein